MRVSAARELRKLRGPQTVEWFEYAASNDDRRVRNDGCGRVAEYFHPVRIEAMLALKDMGVEFKSAEQRMRERKAQAEEERRGSHLRAIEAKR